jgi:4-alpha-glucanotransferase
MKPGRASGILLHPTSLPGRYGIGELGSRALEFADQLAEAGQRLWQVLPLGPTGYGDSPYQCFSAFAGNPLLVDLDALAAEGLLEPGELAAAPDFPEDAVDYEAVARFKLPLLDRAAQRFARSASAGQREELARFRRTHAGWLDDYALFAAAKQAHSGKAWVEWAPELAAREPQALARLKRDSAGVVESSSLWQWLFFRQWHALRERCRARQVALMGDMPIFVAHDSADVWTHRELFRLEPDGRPSVIAGVPPDYFSATGQLWGNPLYRWDELARTRYAWWLERFRGVLDLVDLVRLDHFRGFEAYWEVPGRETTAINGRWVEGPGAALFDALREELGELPIVAENLGVITPEVEALRERFGFPGMAILQFAFGTDPQGDGFRPHNYVRELVVYTGTHDNDTSVGWWTSGVGDSTRSESEVTAERDFAFRYLDAEGRQIHWAMIRTLLASVADTVVIPLQDVLGLGSEARMNLPGRPSGNWRWRVRAGAFEATLRGRLRGLCETYGRVARSEERPSDDPA